MRNIILTLVLVVAVAGAGFFVLSQDENKTAEQTSTPQATESVETTKPEEGTQAMTISFTDSGVSPSTSSISSGQVVTFKNDTSRVVQPASDPHPRHTDNPEFNVSTIQPGQSKTVTLTKTGSWGFHDHLDPDNSGTITVQ